MAFAQKETAFTLALSVLALFAVLQAYQAPQAPAEPAGRGGCSFEGRLVNSLTGQPVAGTTAALEGNGTTPRVRTARTDAAGRFAFGDLAPGSYWLTDRWAGSASPYGFRGLARQDGVALLCSSGERVKDLVLRLMPGGVIAGRVLDERGEPMARVSMVLRRRTYQFGEEQWSTFGTVVSGAISNERGEFRIGGLWAGVYRLVAAAAPAPASKDEAINQPSTGTPERKYVPTYYPGTSDASAATAVEVRAGSETNLADMRLLKIPTVRVRGKVGVAAPTTAVAIHLSPAGVAIPVMDSAPIAAVKPAETEFEMEGVAPGAYNLFAVQDWFFASVPLRLGQSGVEEVDIKLTFGASLSGTISLDGEWTPAADGAFVTLRPSLLSDPQTAAGLVRDAGKFTIPRVFPYRYRLAVEKLPEGFYVKSIRLGDQELTEDWLNFSGGVPRAPLQITLSMAGAQVEGAVQDRDEQPVRGAIVILVPDSGRYSLYRKMRAGEGGLYSFRDVAPGGYKILAFEDIEPDAHLAPDFLSRRGSTAQSVSLQESDRKSVTLKVSPYEK